MYNIHGNILNTTIDNNTVNSRLYILSITKTIPKLLDILLAKFKAIFLPIKEVNKAKIISTIF